MLIQEASDTLNRLSLDEFPCGWLPCCHQSLVQVATLEVSIPIGIKELDKLSDDKIKELIHNRMISVLENKLATLKGVTV